MDDVLPAAFRETVRFLEPELAVMPLSRWNESVLRYSLCRILAIAHQDVEQFVECDRIDLVLRRSKQLAFVEFKFYVRPPRFDPYDGTANGYKGGPGRQNLAEFRACIDQLHERRSTPELSKWVVLVYADSTDGGPDRTYAEQYDRYQHPSPDVSLRLADSGEPIQTPEGVVRAQLYEIGRVVQRP